MDKKTVLAFIMIGLIVILWPYYIKLVSPPGEPAVLPPTGEPSESFKEMVPKEMAEFTAVPEGLRERPISEPLFSATYRDTLGREVVVHTDLYEAVFNTRGALLRSWWTEKYDKKNPERYEDPRLNLISEDDGENLAVLFDLSPETLNFSRAVFSCNKDRVLIDSRNPEETLVFSLLDERGRGLIKEYTFRQGSYAFDLKVRLVGLTELTDENHYRLAFTSALAPTEEDTAMDMRDAKAYALMGNQIETMSAKKDPKTMDLNGQTYWIAARTKYFEIAMIPHQDNPGSGIRFQASIPGDRKVGLKRHPISIRMSLERRWEQEDLFTVYFGPLDYGVLKSLAPKLEQTMTLGFFIIRPFSIAVLWTLKKMYAIIPNYGWVIVIFSVLVKIILYPLTHKSFASMKKMQLLQPQMKEIKEKYKADKQRLQKEMMKLYKEHGVNPMGGCLPMLLQMPLLIALFMVFRSAIDLRGAPFILWIKDLSGPDKLATLPFAIPFLNTSNLNLIPILMGATMFFQQKKTMQDPNQRMMVYFMPIFLTFLFYNWSSGLNLYYTLFNIFSMIQQHFVHGKD